MDHSAARLPRSLPPRRTALITVDRLFLSWYPRLVRALGRRAVDRDDAEDAAQEAFVRLLDANPRDPRAWLFTVATNLVRDRARRDGRRTSLVDARDVAEPSAGADAHLLDDERCDDVRAVLAALAPRDQHLLLMHHSGASYREIARALGVAPGSVGSLLTRAHRRFLTCYESRHETSDRSAQA